MKRQLLAVALACAAACLPAAAALADDDAQLAQALSLRDSGDVKGAIRIYRTLLDGERSERARNGLAIALSWDGKNKEALHHYQILAASKDVEVSLIGRRGAVRVLGWRKRYGSAAKEAHAILAEHPDDRDTLLLLGAVEGWRNHRAQSLAAYDKLLQKDPRDVDALIGRAKTLAWTGRFRESREAYETLLAADPQHVEALVGLTYVEMWTANLPRAREVFERLGAPERARRDVRIVEAALLRARLENPRYQESLAGLRDSFPGDPDVRRMVHQSRIDRGLALDAGGAYSKTSENLETRTAAGRLLLPLGHGAFASAGAAHTSLETPFDSADVDGWRLGARIDAVRRFVFDLGAGRKTAEPDQGGGTFDAAAGWRAADRVTVAASYERDFAFYTPTAVDRDVRYHGPGLSLLWTPRAAIALTASVSRTTFEPSGALPHHRKAANAELRFTAAEHPVWLELGVRGRACNFDRTYGDVGYWNPLRMREGMIVAALVRDKGEMFRGRLDAGFGVIHATDIGTRATGFIRFEFARALSEHIDLTGWAGYYRVSQATGFYDERTARLGLVIHP